RFSSNSGPTSRTCMLSLRLCSAPPPLAACSQQPGEGADDRSHPAPETGTGVRGAEPFRPNQELSQTCQPGECRLQYALSPEIDDDGQPWDEAPCPHCPQPGGENDLGAQRHFAKASAERRWAAGYHECREAQENPKDRNRDPKC